MIAIVAVISTSIHFHSYHFFLVAGINKIWSVCKFDDDKIIVYIHYIVH